MKKRFSYDKINCYFKEGDLCGIRTGRLETGMETVVAVQMKEKQACKKPAVSVIMPAYNAERYIENAIRSVVEQTMGDWELLVLDDCSADGTREVVGAMAQQDSRIRLIENEENMGPARTRNRGLDISCGRYAAFLDSDDLWKPEKLERQLALAEETGAEIIYCSYGIIDECGNKRCNDFIVPESTDLRSMLVKSVFSCSTVLLSERIYRSYRFPMNFYHEDYALWLQFMRDGISTQGIREPLADYRVQSGSRASNKLASAQRRWDIYRRFLKMSVPKSMYYLMRYALAGVIKYRSI